MIVIRIKMQVIKHSSLPGATALIPHYVLIISGTSGLNEASNHCRSQQFLQKGFAMFAETTNATICEFWENVK